MCVGCDNASVAPLMCIGPGEREREGAKEISIAVNLDKSCYKFHVLDKPERL